jgi:hypothetical protein
MEREQQAIRTSRKESLWMAPLSDSSSENEPELPMREYIRNLTDFSLSPRERAGVRGNAVYSVQ